MKKGIIYFLLLLLFTYCCKDDDTPMPPMECLQGLENFTEAAFEVVDSSILECENCIMDCQEIFSATIPYDYSYPCFNPMDGEQLAYYRYDNVQGSFSSELWVMDFCSGEKKMLADNVLYGLDWSVKDWLIYTAEDQNIWKIKSNGDSLTQLTFEGDFNRHPKWSPSGERFAFETERQGETYFFISDELGEAIDTIQELAFISAWTWIDENQLFFTRGEFNGTFTIKKINIYNIENHDIKLLHTLSLEGGNDSLILNSVALKDENIIIWCAVGLVGKTNIVTGEFQIIRERLLQERFHFLTIRPNEQEFVINKSSRHYVGNCHFDSEVEFFLLDTNGENQRRIKVED